MDQHPGDPVAAFALGEAHCTLGRLDGLRGHAWGALRHHQHGVPLLEQVRRQCAGAPEPRASLGVFRYYTARLPRSLRLLARLARVRGDREAGLADLRAAAAAPGVQQFAAAFFLTEILAHSEDETSEALALARRYHGRYPRHMGFTIELADVLVALERPDLALQALSEVDSSDAGVGAQVGVVAARVYLASGRPAAALSRLATIDQRGREEVSWLGPWFEVVCGASLGALGRASEAQVHLDRAEHGDDVAGSRAAARAARDRLADPLWPARTVAESLLAWDGDPEAARRVLEAARAAHPGARADASFSYVLGVAALRAGKARAAADHFAAALQSASGDEAWLRVRPAIRLLQALQWAGEVDAARAAARRIAPELGEWGTNRQLGWLVRDLVGPGSDPIRLAADTPSSDGTLLRLKDTGFTCVTVCVRGARRPLRVPMALRQGYWEARAPLGGDDVLYGFEVERSGLVLDPEARDVVESEGALWSRPVAAARRS
jgi:tetratricopeptide (TPR) repeat protein